MKIEELKKDTPIWVRGYADGLGDIDFLDGERSGMVDCLCEEDIFYMSKSDFRLDETTQPKPVVPQIIFDIIKKFKGENRSFYSLLENISAVKKTWEWLNMTKPGIKESELMQAWLAYPNITVEKEKLYTVEIPNPNSSQKTMLIRRSTGIYLDNFDKDYHTIHFALTEQEIRKDFDWAWQFAKEVTE